MVKHTVRALKRAPAFSIVAVLSLGLAVAANTTLFGFVDALVNPVQPYANAERVFSSYSIGGDRNRPLPPLAVAKTLRAGLGSADATASFVSFGAMVLADGNAEDRIVVAASPNLFELLGVRPQIGRVFDSGDPEAGAVISYALWNQWYQRRPLESGLKLTVGSATFRVVGVMPQGVHFPLSTSAWINLSALPAEVEARSPQPELAFRLRPDAHPDAARRELNATLQNIAQEYGQSVPASAVVVPLHVRSMPLSNYRLMLAIAALVLVIACANLGTMMLARGFAKRREIAIRIALGASRRIVCTEVLAESGVLAICGVAVGILLTLWSMDVIPHWVSGQVPLLGDVRPQPSWRVFAYASVVCVVIVALAGWLPALHAAKLDPAEAMKEGGATTDRRRDRYNPLLILEVALSTGLLTTACLYAQYALTLASFDFRYNANRMVIANVKASVTNVPSTAVAQFYGDAVQRLRNLQPGAEAATRYYIGPDHGLITAESGAGNRWANLGRAAVVSSQYLRALGITMVYGRDFEAGDEAGGPGVVIVDERAAKMLWPNDQNPTGHAVKLGPVESAAPWLRVVGVARQLEFEPRADPDLPPEPQVYVVRPNDLTPDREVVVRGNNASRAEQSALVLAVRQELQAIAPWLGVARVRPWLEKYESSVSYTTFLALVFGAFGVFGLGLCAVGLFGVASYAVSRRSRELSLRIALGASTSHILRIVLHDASVIALGGIGLGALGTLWATRGMRDTLSTAGYQLAGAVIVAECALILVAFAACSAPLVRAASADPVDVLRAN